MFNIVLVEPEIPPNTGNVIRLAANTGATLHLVEPLGFAMEDKLLRRAGLDYHEFADVSWLPGDWLVFGSETAGLKAAVREAIAPSQRVRLPLRPGQRSLNLSNAVAVTVFEAWRQNGFA